MNKFEVIKSMSTARIKLNIGLELSNKPYNNKVIMLVLELKRRKKVEKTEFVKRIIDSFDIEEFEL